MGIMYSGHGQFSDPLKFSFQIYFKLDSVCTRSSKMRIINKRLTPTSDPMSGPLKFNSNASCFYQSSFSRFYCLIKFQHCLGEFAGHN